MHVGKGIYIYEADYYYMSQCLQTGARLLEYVHVWEGSMQATTVGEGIDIEPRRQLLSIHAGMSG